MKDEELIRRCREWPISTSNGNKEFDHMMSINSDLPRLLADRLFEMHSQLVVERSFRQKYESELKECNKRLIESYKAAEYPIHATYNRE